MELSPRIPKIIPVCMVVLALIGFADSTYLTIHHYNHGIALPCYIGNCETVLSSAYAQVFGIPLALLGVLYYFFVLVLLAIYVDSLFSPDKQAKDKLFRCTAAFTVVGFITSLFLFGLQAFVIHAFCQFCLLSAGTSTLLFVLACITSIKYWKWPKCLFIGKKY